MVYAFMWLYLVIDIQASIRDSVAEWCTTRWLKIFEEIYTSIILEVILSQITILEVLVLRRLYRE